MDLKNNAGHDAAFLAERADWSTAGGDGEGEGEGEKEKEKEKANDGGDESRPASKGVQVIELLLNHEGGSMAGDGGGDGDKEDEDGDTNMSGGGASGS